MSASKKARILKHLKSGKSLTAMQALKLFGCARLAARIGELKEEGHNIITKMIKIKGDYVGRYTLIKEQKV